MNVQKNIAMLDGSEFRCPPVKVYSEPLKRLFETSGLQGGRESNMAAKFVVRPQNSTGTRKAYRHSTKLNKKGES
jgi:hypothetical protein